MIAGYATLKEVETEWDLYDVLDAHEVLDYLYEAEKQEIK